MLRYNRALWYSVAVLTLFIIYSSFTYSGVSDKSVTFRIIYTLLYLFFALGVGAISGMSVAALSVVLGKGKGSVGEHRLTLTDEGLEESTAFNRSMNTWAGMRGIKESRGFFFVYVSDNGAHVISKKRPLFEGDLPSFIGECKARIRNA